MLITDHDSFLLYYLPLSPPFWLSLCICCMHRWLSFSIVLSFFFSSFLGSHITSASGLFVFFVSLLLQFFFLFGLQFFACGFAVFRHCWRRKLMKRLVSTLFLVFDVFFFVLCACEIFSILGFFLFLFFFCFPAFFFWDG